MSSSVVNIKIVIDVRTQKFSSDYMCISNVMHVIYLEQINITKVLLGIQKIVVRSIIEPLLCDVK